MNAIREHYIKREAQYRAAQYLAEKRYEREQRLDLFLLGISFLVLASMPLVIVYFG